MQDTDKALAAKQNAKRVLLISLVIAIPAAIYFIFFGFKDGDNISQHGYTAHILGVILAFISAFVFMGITFYSSRSGHDEQPNYRELVEQQRTADTKRSQEQ